MEPEDYEAMLEQLYSSAHSASSEGLTQEAIRRCEEALILIETRGEETDSHSYADFVMLMGDVHWTAGDYEEAWRCYHRVVQNEPERSDARVAMGVALFHLCRFHTSRSVLEMCSIDIPDDAETLYYLGLLSLRDSKRDLAEVYFEQAQELEEERFIPPKPVSDNDIEGVLRTAFQMLPEPFRSGLLEAPIHFEDMPSEALLFSNDPPIDPVAPFILEEAPSLDPDTGMETIEGGGIVMVRAFRDNFALLAGNPSNMREEVLTTIRQEIGHIFKLSDEEMTEKGMDHF